MLQMIAFCLLAAVYGERNQMPDCPNPLSCNVPLPMNSEVEEFCTDRLGFMIKNRCCSDINTLIGLDLRHCGITKLNITYPVFSDLEILDLRENNFEKFSSSDLTGLLNLVELYLPKHLPCPGGPNCWNESNNMTKCSGQRDPCTSLNISCGEPENAHCIHTGPGSAKCECQPGYFGYKCLNEGEFPVTGFTLGVILPTIVLSVALWFIQGRDPYKQQGNVGQSF
ncbi:hypothetical protein JTE90_016944 [Oedothorax gibbosus]|uniref:EGF-like domain-containing protein n=1 Tax=Oedothorax gibbosus TaxID=931172 RepID=A0AAV6UV75_9ARAC|nr:hypothetical protein JTE90_016944 [Oedothorax gibbosus]